MAEEIKVVKAPAPENLFVLLLGSITPEYIQELTTISSGSNKSSLTSMIENEVLIASSHLKLVEENSDIQKNNESQTLKNNELKTEPISDESAGTSVLIFDVKRKLKDSQHKLKEAEIHDLYHKNSLIDINQEKLNRQDLNKSSNLGVLVNKRQA